MPRHTLAVILLALAVAAAGCLEAPGATEDDPAPVEPGSMDLPEEVERLLTGEPCVTALPEPDFHADAQVEEWTGEVDGNVTVGRLHVQSFDGGVLLLPWNQSGYRVEVGEVDPDDRLTPTVDASVADGVFQLDVRVDDAGGDPAPITVNEQRPMAQVMVWVPALDYQSVEVRDFPEEEASESFHLRVNVQPVAQEAWRSLITGDLRGERFSASVLNLGIVAEHLHFATVNASTLDGDVALHGAVGDAVRVSSHDGEVCASGVSATALKASSLDGNVSVKGVQADETRASSHDGAVSAQGVEGRSLNASSLDGDVTANGTDVERVRLSSHDGAVTAQQVRAGNLSLSSLNGDVSARGVDAPTLRLSSHDGAVTVEDARVVRLNASSLNGDVSANATPTASGWMKLSSHDGAVMLHVPAGPDHGYNATASTHNGAARVNLTNADHVDASDDGRRAHAVTAGFADRAVQVMATASSLNGDVVIESA